MTPVQEVEFFLHRQEAHAAIEKRKSAVLKSVTVTYTTPAKAEAPTTASSAKKKVKTPPDYIVVHDSSSEEDEGGPSPQPQSAAVHTAATTTGATHVREPPGVTELMVPKTIRSEWIRVERLFRDGHTDAPRCSCPSCPYSRGAPMLNRYNLIERLVELEHYLWGD